MLRKKIIVSCLSITALALSSSALANGFIQNANSGPYIGIQGGYGDNHANNLQDVVNNANALATVQAGIPYPGDVDFDHSGVVGRVFAGYDFNQYLAVEGGYTYFQKTDIKFAGQKVGDIGTSAFDVVGKITVPVVDNFGLYAKAGPGYLKSDFRGVDNSNTNGDTHNFDLVYGFGADYAITPNWVADASFTRFSGHQKFDSKYQPDADMYALGIAYKFNV